MTTFLEFVLTRLYGRPYRSEGNGRSHWQCPMCGSSDAFSTRPREPGQKDRASCFSCGEWGDAFDWIKRGRGCDDRTAWSLMEDWRAEYDALPAGGKGGGVTVTTTVTTTVQGGAAPHHTGGSGDQPGYCRQCAELEGELSILRDVELPHLRYCKDPECEWRVCRVYRLGWTDEQVRAACGLPVKKRRPKPLNRPGAEP